MTFDPTRPSRVTRQGSRPVAGTPNPMDCRRRTTPGHPCCYCRSCQSHCSHLSPYPCLCHRCWGWGQEGEGPLEDTAVPAMVGTEAAAAVEGTLLLRHGVECGGLSLGCRVIQLNLLEFEVVTNSVEGGKRLRPLDEDLHVIEPLV
jgi:hypothetical protein